MRRIAIIGGGPSSLLVYKRLLESGRTDFSVDIFESKYQLGPGMPYSDEGSNLEHVTNVSGNEIPDLAEPLFTWLSALNPEKLRAFGVDAEKLSEYKVVPRLLFGKYLKDQFEVLWKRGRELGIKTNLRTEKHVKDMVDYPEIMKVAVKINENESLLFDHSIICTGHSWPHVKEDAIKGYFDSPYPPSKLIKKFNHPIAIQGCSLTAVDAIRTLARQHGAFNEDGEKLHFVPHSSDKNFRIVMHSRHGLLPCIRFHVDTPHLGSECLIDERELTKNKTENEGFISLDFLVDKNFKEPLRDKDPAFFARIKDMSLEDFVHTILDLREKIDPFTLFKIEYDEAARSIKRRQSIHWKEMLAALSFAVNYPAKHMSAEDMIRHQDILMPLISVVIAFMPQKSCQELIALHEAGRLDLIEVGSDGYVEPGDMGGCVYHFTDAEGRKQAVPYQTFIDCSGQRRLSIEDFPFQSLVHSKTVIPARLPFKSVHTARKFQASRSDIEAFNGTYYLRVPGISIADDFAVVGQDQVPNQRIYMMAVPYIGGYNPDYSGLDFCEEASARVVKSLFK